MANDLVPGRVERPGGRAILDAEEDVLSGLISHDDAELAAPLGHGHDVVDIHPLGHQHCFHVPPIAIAADPAHGCRVQAEPARGDQEVAPPSKLDEDPVSPAVLVGLEGKLFDG